jgi:hypothetical protein
METEQVRGVAQKLGVMADDLSTLALDLRSKVKRTDWEGSSRDRFVTDSTSLFDSIENLADAGIILSQRLVHEVEEWEQVDEDGVGRIEEVGGLFLTIAASIAIFIAISYILVPPVKAPIIRGENLVGRGDELNIYYKAQTGNTCGFQATQNILKAYGKNPTLTELKKSAGYEADKEGNKYDDFQEMFEANGVKVDVHPSFSSDKDAVENSLKDLKDGKAVVALIDTEPLDYWDGNSGGHAVWVTGVRIDDEGNITHIVCNDSGFNNDNYKNGTWDGTSMESGSDGQPDGMGIEYPISEFLDAWEKWEYSYIGTQEPMPSV